MTDTTTIAGIYEALNPLPALLSAKGKVRPEVKFMLDANADFCVFLSWTKDNSRHDYDTDCEIFRAETFAGAVANACAYINALPSGEQAKLNRFMSALGKVIDLGNDGGIDVDYLNPLVETMKRISENAITYRASAEPA